MSADDLLAALDPEQREVATALRGPVRVLAGAGTGKTRAITHRIAYGVATGVYNPTEVLAVTFTTRAAGEMRGAPTHARGRPGVQARTFHSAALRQVRYFWPRVYGGEPPQLIESKLGLVAGAARRNRVADRPGAAARRRLRDRVVQGQQRPPRRLRPRRADARPRGQRARPRDGRAPVRQLRGPQARAGPDGHGGRPALRRRDPGRGRAGRRRRCAGSTSGSSSTSSRTSRRSRPRCSTCGSAAATRSAWSATRRRRSTASPVPGRRTSRSSRARTTAPRRVPGPQLPLDAAGDRGRQQAARRHRVGRRAAARAARVRARRHLARAARRGGRGRRRRPRDHPPPPRGHAAARDGDRCSGSTPSPRRSRRH